MSAAKPSFVGTSIPMILMYSASSSVAIDTVTEAPGGNGSVRATTSRSPPVIVSWVARGTRVTALGNLF